jgi:aryl-alcohol dehydrogenase-like predicted oxidoreductase
VIAPRVSGEVTANENSPLSALAVQDAISTRNLGKTGFRAAIFGLGGQGALEKANIESLALKMIQRALELGVNYFDTSAIYGGPDRGVNVIWERVLKELGIRFLLRAK